jgi:hypothetical protein
VGLKPVSLNCNINKYNSSKVVRYSIIIGMAREFANIIQVPTFGAKMLRKRQSSLPVKLALAIGFAWMQALPNREASRTPSHRLFGSGS